MIKRFHGLLCQIPFVDQSRLRKWKDFCHKQEQRCWSIVRYFSFATFFVYKKYLPSLRIDGNLPSENVTFIKSVRGSLRGFLNCLKSLFGMLKGPVLLSFLRVWTALPLCLLDLIEMYLQRRRYTSKNIKKSWQTTDTG